jgi:hypothetical protein
MLCALPCAVLCLVVIDIIVRLHFTPNRIVTQTAERDDPGSVEYLKFHDIATHQYPHF